MTENTTFEVHVQQGDQWTIHENYTGGQREDAIEDAKATLAQRPDLDAVKVVKETLDTDTGIFSDTVIFKAAAPKKAKPKKVYRGTGQTGAAKRGDTAQPRTKTKSGKKERHKELISLKQFAVRLLMVVFFSAFIAALFAMGATEFLGGTRTFGIRFVGRAETNLLATVFIFTFLIAASGLTIAVLRNVKLKKGKTGRLALWILAWQAKSRQRAAERLAANRAANAARAQKAARTGVAAGPSEEVMAEAAKEQPAPEPVVEEPQEPPAPEPEPEPQATGNADALSPTAEKLKTYMVNFLAQSFEGSQTDKDKMDSFNKFGVSLYMAGACEILSQKGDMDVLTQSKILAEAVQIMGFKKSHAAAFAERYEEYLMADSRYMQMFQAGRNAINTYLADEGAGPKLFDNAIVEWNKPKQKEEQTGPVTVMFTDIAGSTAMTQALGDEGAQQVVRVHNRIVREALSAHAGKEVKHTGDGIMASFAKTSDGIDATMQMQQETAKYTEANPDLPLHLKIGLNAGEPIAEDNDLFGTVVQLSARIVDKASADQIYVSEIVRGICAGKSYKFVNLGTFEMKGFGEDPTLFEVIWNPDAAEIPAAPSPATAP